LELYNFTIKSHSQTNKQTFIYLRSEKVARDCDIRRKQRNG